MKTHNLLKSIVGFVLLPVAVAAQNLPPPTNYWADNDDYQQMLNNDVTVLSAAKSDNNKYDAVEGQLGVQVFVGPQSGETSYFIASYRDVNDEVLRYNSRSHAASLYPGYAQINPANTTKWRPQNGQQIFAAFSFRTQDEEVRKQFLID